MRHIITAGTGCAMRQFYYVQKPNGDILEYTRLSKAERVARLYNVQVLENPTQAQRDAAISMYL